MHEPAPQEFALQFWDEQKYFNTSLVVGIMGMLISSKGNNVRTMSFPRLPFIEELHLQAQESLAFTRCLVEIALASNAPTRLKTQVNQFNTCRNILTQYPPGFTGSASTSHKSELSLV